jgi:DNA-binding MarR family transcriptional regulator
MATRDPLRKFAERGLQIDKILDGRGVNGKSSRVTWILNAANRSRGVTQKQVVAETSLPKDVVSKQVGELVAKGLLVQKREFGNSLIKRLHATDAGKELLGAIKEILLPTKGAKADLDQDEVIYVQTTSELK